MANNYGMMTPYLDSFMGGSMGGGQSWKEKHLQPSAPTNTYIPLNNASAAMKTNNMKLGDPTNLTDTRSNPLVTTQQALTSSTNTSNQSIAGSSTLANPIQDEKPWYGKLPNTEGGPPVKPMNMAVDLNYTNRLAGNQQRNAMQSSRELGLEDPAAFQKRMQKQKLIHNKMLEGVNPALEKPTRPDTSHLSYKDEFEGQYNRFANEGKGGWGSSGSATPAGEDILEDVAFDDRFLGGKQFDKMVEQSAEGLIPEKGFMEKAGDFVNSEGFGKLMAFSPLIGAVTNYKQTQSAIDDLSSAKSQAEGARSNLANAKEAELSAASDQFSEDRRRVGALEKEGMIGNLEKIANARTGGLVSGEKIEMSEDVVDTAQTRADISMAKLEDQKNELEGKIQTANKEERQKLNQTIQELDSKIDEMKKQSIAGPVGAMVDIGSNLLMASNPALAIGMQVGKTLIS